MDGLSLRDYFMLNELMSRNRSPCKFPHCGPNKGLSYFILQTFSYARLFCGMVHSFTLPEVNCLLELAPQFTLPDPTHIGGFILMWMWLDALRFRGGGSVSTTETTHNIINMSSSNWRDGEICQLLTVMGEQVMQSHNALNALNERGFCRDKKQVVSKIKNMLAFLHFVNS